MSSLDITTKNEIGYKIIFIILVTSNLFKVILPKPIKFGNKTWLSDNASAKCMIDKMINFILRLPYCVAFRISISHIWYTDFSNNAD